MDLEVDHRDILVAWLLAGSIFFAMRSCEYLTMWDNEYNEGSMMLRLRNLLFKKSGQLLSHDSMHLTTVDFMAITFEFQKAKRRNKTVYISKKRDKKYCRKNLSMTNTLRSYVGERNKTKKYS